MADFIRVVDADNESHWVNLDHVVSVLDMPNSTQVNLTLSNGTTIRVINQNRHAVVNELEVRTSASR